MTFNFSPFDFQSKLSSPRQGWQCPVCQRGNAPWIPYCDCTKAYQKDVIWPDEEAAPTDEPYKPSDRTQSDTSSGPTQKTWVVNADPDAWLFV